MKKNTSMSPLIIVPSTKIGGWLPILCSLSQVRKTLSFFFVFPFSLTHSITARTFEEVSWHFLVAGHTKFSPDTMFGWLSNALKEQTLLEVSDVVQKASAFSDQNSYTTTILPRSAMVNWKKFLDPHVRAVPQINSYHRMRVRIVEGVLVLEGKFWSSDLSWKRLNVIKKPFEQYSRLELLPFVELKSQKLADLHQLEQFAGGVSLSYCSVTAETWV